MDAAVYKKVLEQITSIRQMVDKKRAKNNTQPDLTSQLIEIETYIIKIFRFLELAQVAD